jgi:hypothetical protein
MEMGEIISQDVSGRLKRSLGHYTDLTSLTSQLADSTTQLGQMVTIPKGMVSLTNNPNFDNSSIINTAISTAPDGATILIPFPIKANIIVARNNINIVSKKGKSSTGVYVYPFDLTKPALTLGDGVTTYYNIQLDTVSLRGSGSDADVNSVGLFINGIQESIFNNLRAESFGSDNVYINSTTTASNSYLYFNNLITKSSRKSNFNMQYGSSWSSAIYISNLQSVSGNGVNSRGLTVGTTCELYIVNGWLQAGNRTGIDLSGFIKAQNFFVDSNSSSDVLVKQLNSDRPSIYGNYFIDGFIENNNNLQYKLPSNMFAYYESLLQTPSIMGGLFLLPANPTVSSDYTPSTNYQIIRSNNQLYFYMNGKYFYFDGGNGTLRNLIFERNTTPNRPTLTSSDNGYAFYDTTLRKLIVWDGTAWKNPDNIIAGNVGVNTPVSASVTSLSVTFTTPESDDKYGIFITPYWNTAFWISAKLATGFTVNFAAAPSAATTLDWKISR